MKEGKRRQAGLANSIYSTALMEVGRGTGDGGRRRGKKAREEERRKGWVRKKWGKMVLRGWEGGKMGKI